MVIDTHIIITQMQMFASLIVIGIFIQRAKILTDENITHFSALLTRFIIPCMLLTMMPNGGSRADIISSGKFILIGLLYIIAIFILGNAAAALLGFRSKARKRMHAIICSFGNAGFLGSPLCAAVFPSLGVANALYVLLEAVFCWIVGPITADPDSKFNRDNLKNLVTPITVSIAVGFLLTGLDIHPAGLIPWDTVSAIGSTTKYFACFYIGLNLGKIGFRKIFADKRVLVSSVLKLFLFPVLLYAIIRPMHILSDEMMGLMLIMASTPTGMAVPMVADVAHGDREYAISGTMTNTILCLFTIPLVCQFCMSVFG